MSIYTVGNIIAISIHSTARVETKKVRRIHLAWMISIHSTARVETLVRPPTC